MVYTSSSEDEFCFFLRCNDGYLKELVYNRITNISDELIGTYLYRIIGDEKKQPSGTYSSGIIEIDRIMHDVNNDKTNMILGFDCEPGQSKKEIVAEFEKKFPFFQPIIQLERFAFLPVAVQLNLDLFLFRSGFFTNNLGLDMTHSSLLDVIEKQKNYVSS